MDEGSTKNLPPPNDKAMALGDHLGELRSRLIKSLWTLLVVFVLAMSQSTPIIDFLKKPLVEALPKGSNALHFTSPFEPFMVQMQVAFLTAILVGGPVWMYQFWRFVEPALYPRERRFVLPIALSSIALFITGILFCFYVMLPFALDFLIGMGLETATAMITISDYINVLLLMILAFGLVFQTPLILVLLAIFGIIDVGMLTKNRRIIIVLIFILSAILTPPDPISQVAMAVPMMVMFEASILAIRLLVKKKGQLDGADAS